MMTPQGLQIVSPEDSLAGLGIITNGIVIVNIVFRVCIAGCRRVPVHIQGFTYLFLLHGLLQVLLGFHVHLPLGINPGTPVSTTGLILCRVLIPSLISFIASSGSVEILKFSLIAVSCAINSPQIFEFGGRANGSYPQLLMVIVCAEMTECFTDR